MSSMWEQFDLDKGYLIQSGDDPQSKNLANVFEQQIKRELLKLRVKAYVALLTQVLVLVGGSFAAGVLFASNPWIVFLPIGLGLMILVGGVGK